MELLAGASASCSARTLRSFGRLRDVRVIWEQVQQSDADSFMRRGTLIPLVQNTALELNSENMSFLRGKQEGP